MTVLVGGSNNTILSTTWANKPASYPVGQSVFITNAGTKGSHWFFDGTRWKPVGGIASLASLETATGNIANSETNAFQYLLPAGLWQTGDRLRFTHTQTKSGTTDSAQVVVRIGTAGTTGDTAVLSRANLQGVNIQAGTVLDIRLESATSALVLSSSRAILGYSNASITAFDAAVTISSAAANALYVSVNINSNGTTDTTKLIDAQLQLVAKAN